MDRPTPQLGPPTEVLRSQPLLKSKRFPPSGRAGAGDDFKTPKRFGFSRWIFLKMEKAIPAEALHRKEEFKSNPSRCPQRKRSSQSHRGGVALA